MRTALITIDQSALIHNIKQTVKYASTSSLMVMLKADAYGHGIDICTHILLSDNNVSAIGVATIEEALQIRKLGWNRTIVLIEGVFSLDGWLTAIQYNLQTVIHHQQQLDWVLKQTPENNSDTQTIWLKYNTGMNRLGFNTDEIMPIAKQLHKHNYKQVLTSHFANSDIKDHPLNAQQGQLFSDKLIELKQSIDPTIKGSICNSAGILNFPQWHYDWVRSGIMIYGSSPIKHQTARTLNLKPVMTLSTKIMAIHALDTGDMVGYGSLWTAKNPRKIAIISIGYGDGYPRVVNDLAFVQVNTSYQNYQCPIVGRVAMDMIMIDITNTEIHINDEVIMWGDNPHIDTIAKSANTISYELMCRLTNRPNRQYKRKFTN